MLQDTKFVSLEEVHGYVDINQLIQTDAMEGAKIQTNPIAIGLAKIPTDVAIRAFDETAASINMWLDEQKGAVNEYLKRIFKVNASEYDIIAKSIKALNVQLKRHKQVMKSKHVDKDVATKAAIEYRATHDAIEELYAKQRTLRQVIYISPHHEQLMKEAAAIIAAFREPIKKYMKDTRWMTDCATSKDKEFAFTEEESLLKMQALIAEFDNEFGPKKKCDIDRFIETIEAKLVEIDRCIENTPREELTVPYKISNLHFAKDARIVANEYATIALDMLRYASTRVFKYCKTKNIYPIPYGKFHLAQLSMIAKYMNAYSLATKYELINHFTVVDSDIYPR